MALQLFHKSIFLALSFADCHFVGFNHLGGECLLLFWSEHVVVVCQRFQIVAWDTIGDVCGTLYLTVEIRCTALQGVLVTHFVDELFNKKEMFGVEAPQVVSCGSDKHAEIQLD